MTGGMYLGAYGGDAERVPTIQIPTNYETQKISQ